jgi:hypothetical protein
MYVLHHQREKNPQDRNNVSFNHQTDVLIRSALVEAIRSSETSVAKKATRRNIPEDDILHSHRRENLKSYIALTGWAL